MDTVLSLLILLGILGAIDTLYFHEWRANLPRLGKQVRSELLLHSARDGVYAILFATLPWLRWQGWWAALLLLLLATEVVLTFWDFVAEDRTRQQLGGVYPAERIMHGVMGIVYGAMLAFLLPITIRASTLESRLGLAPAGTRPALRWFSVALAMGVFLSGLRDACAAFELRGSAWPWRPLDKT